MNPTVRLPVVDWLNKTNSEYTLTRTLLGVVETDASSWVVRNRLEGNFPGNVVDLVYRFDLHDDRIATRFRLTANALQMGKTARAALVEPM